MTSAPKSKVRVRLLVGLGGFAVLVVAGLVAARVVLSLWTIPSGGMSPTFVTGDTFWMNRFDKDVAVGDVIVFEFPENREQDFVQRVIALGGTRTPLS